MSNNPKESTVSLEEYKGSPVLTLNKDSKFPFSFGLAKAKLIVSNFEAIQKFVESEGKAI